MTIYKTIITSLFLVYEAFAYTNILQFNKKINNNISSFIKRENIQQTNIKHITGLNLNRRKLFKFYGFFPYIPLKYIITKPAIAAAETKKEKTIDELRKEALNIIDIIEVQKGSINLPSLSSDEKNETDYNVNIKTKIKIDGVLENIMNNCKKYGLTDPVKSVSNLQKYCSESNIIKNKNTRGLTASFQDGKYSLLLGKFLNYEIINYEKNIDNNSDDKNNIYYSVDMKVNAKYKTMLQNSIQFNDMYYPKNRDYNNVCYVIYRWLFKKYKDDNLYLEGCFLVPATSALIK
jgi:hypothetical protein